MGVACGEEFDDQRFAGFDLNGDFFAGLQAVEEAWSREHADVGVGLEEFVVLEEDFRVQQIA